MRRWLRIAVPLGIATVLVTLLAIGFGSPSSHAAKPTAGPEAPSGCNTAMDETGRLGPGKAASYSATFCSDPTDSFVVWVTWGNRINADKDLALHVTAPDGREFHVDDDPSAIEVFVAYAPLPEGDWLVEVINEGSRSVKYEISIAFG
jgi:hypothetical protein